jgi:CspA family cold shock protein
MSTSERFTGRVKWFNNKAGYGFVTVTDGPKSGSDVFVHHSSIKVDSEQYKYLVQGEYIEFSLSDTKTDKHEFQAGEVSGIKGGKLMCETRRESRVARTQYRTQADETNETHGSKVADVSRSSSQPKSISAPRARGQGPRADLSSQETKPSLKRGRPSKSAEKH